MLTSDLIFALKEKYSNLHPLIFARSVERANTDVELFDILDTVPKEYPFCWNEEEKRYVSCKLFKITVDLNREI